jgi:hypothetical protein
VLLDLKTVRTILGGKHRPKYRSRKKRAAEWEVAVGRPTYELTIFKLHCGGLILKIYSKRERVLRIEVIVHNARHKQPSEQYGPTRAAYDLKKFRGQQIVERIGQSRRYQANPTGLKAITALIVLRDKAIKPLLAVAQGLRPNRGAQNPTPLDAHYDPVRSTMRGVFHELGIAA